jgi:hypothetical protein
VRVLVACEFSGVVRDAFRAKGHVAWSCDILPSDDPEYHIQGDVLDHLDRHKWDLIIAHPPCTYLSNSGVCHLYKDKRKENGVNVKRWADMVDGARFFEAMLNAPADKICVENPVMHGYAKELIGVKQTQVVQPWMFGHMEKKATCLWLKNLPPLVPTNNVKTETDALPKNIQQRLHYLPPSEDRQMLRSITYQGLADAMADQWGDL